MTPILELLTQFSAENGMDTNKGGLCVGLVVTRHAKKLGLPLEPKHLLTAGKGQVLGLGKSAVQAILNEYGIKRILAEEGGRTSRGSIGNMQKYVDFLNSLSLQVIDLDLIEKWWIKRVSIFFESKPLSLKYDPSLSLRAIVHSLLMQAQKRQVANPGSTYLGTVLQHLIGAKLEQLMPDKIQHHGASVADGMSGRDADFVLQDVYIHVTTAPNEALIRKCDRNLEKGHRPVIVTLQNKVSVAEGLAEQSKIANRVDIFDGEQFIAGNLYELGKFNQKTSKLIAIKLIDKYNEIISKNETDPSLRIEFQ